MQTERNNDRVASLAISKQLYKEKLNNFYKLTVQHEDEQTEEKLVDLYEKYINDEFIVTFAGHFSAGKSSMINKLLEEDILPNSPIPTSANIVKIKAGDGAAQLHLNNHHIVRYDPPYDIEMIKDFCMDKSNIQLIELSTTNKVLPDRLTLIDTPGIDAADDYDRQLTEASLHLTDLLFYVMDYNHVQSEVNLLFLKQLQTYKIPFYIIVNQIDKHSATEISFHNYKSLVKQTFVDWGLKPVNIFFTSLKDFSLPHNDFSQLTSTILQAKDHMTIDHNRSVNHLVKEHKQYLQTIYDEKIETVAITEDERKSYEKAQKLLMEIEQHKKRLITLKSTLENELNHTLNNAYLMPFATREQARLFLEANESDFKVGFFRSKQKTELERANRLQTLYETMLTTIDTALTWSLREKFQRIIEKENINDPSIDGAIQALTITFTKNHLLDLIHPGATVNGPYVLNYTKQVSETIKQLFKRAFTQLWEYVETQLMAHVREKDALYKSYEQLKKQFERKKLANERITKEHEKQLSHLANIQTTDHYKGSDDIIAKIIVERNIYKPEQLPEAILLRDKQLCKTEDPIQTPIDNELEKSVKSDHLLTKIEQTIELINDLPSFTHVVNDLIDKQQRLTNRQLTVALFGAFSAGKSSFANALMGEQILPSSPNPTTAAITRIHPVTETKPHGTIVVTFKDEATIINDLTMMLKDYFVPEGPLKQIIKWIKKENILQRESLNNMFQVYIHSLVSGYETMKQYFGKQMTVSFTTFNELATVETKACFVAAIDLYYASDLTNKGITLVDTPGADSIHARHTDVSFNYIKNADAIIYVTYYNHAFAKADKDFIMQLGRVKEAFELDKMFFIVNAADLAADDVELNVVINHVKDELLHLGVRSPNIFPISSKQSIENKVNNEPLNEQMKTFERKFNDFIDHDLTTMITEAAFSDIERTKQLLEQYIEKVSLDVLQKEQMITSLNDTKNDLLNAFNNERATIYEAQIIERIKRQLHYVKERFAINFHDLFGETFNPTTIKSGHRQELENCLRELINHARFELLQEMRAVSLRIEAMIRTLTKDLYIGHKQTLQSIERQFLLPTFTNVSLESPTLKEGLQEIDQRQLHQSLKLFKSKRAFFEQRQSELIKESLYENLVPYIDDYMTSQQKLMIDFYKQTWDEIFTAFATFSEREINQYINHQIAMLEEQIDVNILQEKVKQLSVLIEKDVGRNDNE